jgi:SNF2 family DNA or RNA helicase
MIQCPDTCLSSVIDNWKREFESWGHFAVSLYQGSERVNELERVRVGINDIMICGKALFVDDANLTKMEKVPWKLIIVDEFHEFKNLKAKCYEQLYNLREQSKCPILGLTGTLMANNHKELWALIDMVHRGLLGSWDAFNKMVSLPIMHSRYEFIPCSILVCSIYIFKLCAFL